MERVNPALVPQRKLSNGMVIPGIGMGTLYGFCFRIREVPLVPFLTAAYLIGVWQ